MQFLAVDHYDLLITDFQMPGVNGEALCQAVRDEMGLRDLPILMCSAKGLELDTQELRNKWNVTQVMFKPFSMRDRAAGTTIDIQHADFCSSIDRRKQNAKCRFFNVP